MADERIDDTRSTPAPTPARRVGRPFAGPAGTPRAARPPLLKPPVTPMRPTRPPFASIMVERAKESVRRSPATAQALAQGLSDAPSVMDDAASRLDADASVEGSHGETATAISVAGLWSTSLEPGTTEAPIDAPTFDHLGTEGGDAPHETIAAAQQPESFEDPWQIQIEPSDEPTIDSARQLDSLATAALDHASEHGSVDLDAQASAEPAWLRADAPTTEDSPNATIEAFDAGAAAPPAGSDHATRSDVDWPDPLLAEYAPYVPTPTSVAPLEEPAWVETPGSASMTPGESVHEAAAVATSALDAGVAAAADAALGTELETTLDDADGARMVAAATLRRLADRVRSGEIDVSSVAPDATEAAVLATLLAALLRGSARS